MATVRYCYADVGGQQLSYRDAAPAAASAVVRATARLLRLEPGQSVVPHRIDRDFTTDEVAPGRKP